jgi:hypothetical protein
MTTHPHPEPSEEASSLPPYIYGHETSGMEKVWTEASVRTLKAERDEALTKLHALQALSYAGSLMATTMFNLAQKPGYVLTEADCKLLKSMQVKWDAAREALRAAVEARP